MIIKTRTLTADDLRQRLADLRAFTTNSEGLAECVAYDIEDTRAKIERAERGEVIREGWDTTYRAWQDLDIETEAR